ncbi:DUF6527 family protein [Burkholderia pseudomallei]|uniref:DUF6527 family protein n=1 Tax=Burkholderia pseudomallei TaxID=28450 RepID=UPI000A1CAB07|nr:DUF6527 family protein [Burkholderia pseudomallei]
MMRITTLEHRFVRNVPRELDPGILYVSMDYATVVHSCCCGCGEQVVTPLSPTDWKMTYDGVSISLAPSIGNWQLPCRSHYVIRQGHAIEAGPWSAAEIAAEHRRDAAAKARFYGKPAVRQQVTEGGTDNRAAGDARPTRRGAGRWWSSVAAWLSGGGSDK